MKRNFRSLYTKNKNNLLRRLENTSSGTVDSPLFSSKNIHYEMSEKAEAIHCGGIGGIHQMVQKIGLIKNINDSMNLLKIHKPYFESDHILNMSYNLIAGGEVIDDLERLRMNPAYMNSLGAKRIPDPTTAGDFLRRFEKKDVEELMDVINETRKDIWKSQDRAFKKEGIINIDATIEETTGECKKGMDMSYNGKWSYAPLFVSLANTREVLYIENRSGNTRSCDNAEKWIDKSIQLTSSVFKKVQLRGDADYSLTKKFDEWDSQGIDFVFGFRNVEGLKNRADQITSWKPLERRIKKPVKTKRRRKKPNVKNRIVKRREYKVIRQTGEYIAEFSYKPTFCDQPYRMIVLKKDFEEKKGEKLLLKDYDYFFYITNATKKEFSTSDVIFFSNDRCDHENDIEQLRNGVKALKMPTNDLISNWAYIVIASLAWNLKAWMGLLMPDKKTGREIIRMEFRKFLAEFINIPAQIIRTGRKYIFRFLGFMNKAPPFFGFLEKLKTFSV